MTLRLSLRWVDWQLQKRLKNIPILVADSTVPVSTALVNPALHFIPKVKLLRRNHQPLSQHQQFLMRWQRSPRSQRRMPRSVMGLPQHRVLNSRSSTTGLGS